MRGPAVADPSTAAQPLRVALVLGASTGGIGRHVASLAPRLVARGHTVRVYAPPLTTATQGFDRLGLDVSPLTALPRLRHVDVVHAHGYKAAGLALGVARLRRTPLVVTWHNAVLGAAWAPRLLQRVVARGADLTLGASSDLVTSALRLGARHAVLAPVAAPALDAPREEPARRRQTLGLHQDDVLVLSVSRLAPQKNLGLLLDIAAAFRDRPGVRFVVVGEGPLRAELADRVAREDLPVTLLGGSDDLASWYAAADLFLLTSTWEARALVAQEALLAGVALVSTRVGGIEELVGDAAVLFDPADPAAGIHALRGLVDDPAARARLAAAGRARAATWPDEEDVVDDLVARYRGVRGPLSLR